MLNSRQAKIESFYKRDRSQGTESRRADKSGADKKAGLGQGIELSTRPLETSATPWGSAHLPTSGSSTLPPGL